MMPLTPKNHYLKLHLLTHKQEASLEVYLEFVVKCIKSGVSLVQLREKQLSYEDLLYIGKALKSTLDSFSVPLIVNDDIQLCLELEASGVHLGQSDGDPLLARKILGPDKIIGLTVNTLEQLKKANELPIDYVGLGAIFPTRNKPNVETLWGLEGLKRASALCKHPIVSIGGIHESNALSVIKSGAQGIAGIGVFHDSPNIVATVHHLRRIIDNPMGQQNEI